MLFLPVLTLLKFICAGETAPRYTFAFPRTIRYFSSPLAVLSLYYKFLLLFFSFGAFHPPLYSVVFVHVLAWSACFSAARSMNTLCSLPLSAIRMRVSRIFRSETFRGNSEILLNLETQVSLQKKFIQRAGGISDTDKYLARLNEQLRSFPVVSRKELYKLISSVYREIIQQLNDENKFVVIPKRNEYAKHFTKNFHDLHTNLNVSYRTMSKPLDMSIGNLTRLEKGGEPMLNTVIKLADYFGVSITALISASPNFDYKRISKTFSPKQPPKRINDISSEKLSKQNHFYYELLSPANIQKEIGQFF